MNDFHNERMIFTMNEFHNDMAFMIGEACMIGEGHDFHNV